MFPIRFRRSLTLALVAAALGGAGIASAYAQGGHYSHEHVVRDMPRGQHYYAHGGDHYYFHNGFWYRPYGVNFIAVGPPFGLQVDYLPWGYRTVVVSGVTYFVLNDVWYQQAGPGGYVVVAPPPDAPVVATAPVIPSQQGGGEMYIYPSHGQDEALQAKDRYECHSWASSQTGFDPTRPMGGVPADSSMQKRADYQRAMTACLVGRGYTVN